MTESPSSFDDFAVGVTPKLLRFGRQIAFDRETAEDLVQFGLLKAWEHWPRLQKMDDPVAYVKRAIVNRHLSSWRRITRREVLYGSPPEPAETPSDDGSVASDWAVEALRALPPRQRVVIVLRYFDDCSVAETADLLGCSQGTVKSQSSRALNSMRKSYSCVGSKASQVPDPATDEATT